MDNRQSDAYLHRMFARAITMLAIFAIAVVATMTSAHAARMSAVPDHAVHAAEMMQGSHDSKASCNDEQHCGPSGAGLCEFICTGLSVFIPLASCDAGHDCSMISHDRPADEFHAGRAPGLSERPPKIRLL